MYDVDGKLMLNHFVLGAINSEIGARLKGTLGREEPLPANLERLMLALAQANYAS
jgi:hypothetical protein